MNFTKEEIIERATARVEQKAPHLTYEKQMDLVFLLVTLAEMEIKLKRK